MVPIWSLDECPAGFKPVFYRRFMDDIFVLFIRKFVSKEEETNNRLSFLGNEISLNKSQYTDLHPQFRSSYYAFLGSCCNETEKFRANLCFDSSEHSSQTADDNNKVRYFTNALVLNILKLVLLYFSLIMVKPNVTLKTHSQVSGNFWQLKAIWKWRKTPFFTTKTLSVLMIFKFLSWLFGHVASDLITKVRLMSNLTNNCNTHIAQYLEK